MSDHTDDRRPPTARGPHPDDALAGYVDGTATLAERQIVDSHLASCAACRSDLERARSARAVLGALPEIDPPALLLPTADPRGIPAPEPAAAGGRGGATPLRPGRDRDVWGKAMGALVAAAAVVAVILGSFVLFRGGGSQTASTAAGSGGLHAPSALASTPARDYTAASMNALADSIARTPPQTDTAPSPDEGSATTDTQLAAAIEDCTRRASKATGTPILLVSGTFKGRPADIAVFRETTGDSSQVLVVAAQPDSCRLLYDATARAAAPTP